MTKHVNDDSIYDIQELADREVERLEEEGVGRFSRTFYLSPGKNENERKTHLRPVFLPNNAYGQTRATYIVPCHKGLDKLKPGTKRRLFPRIKPGTESVVCLNAKKDDDNCPVCVRAKEVSEELREAEAVAKSTGSQKDVIRAKSLRMYYSSIKRTLFHFFVAVKHIGPVASGDEKEKGKMAIGMNPEKAIEGVNPRGYCRVPPDQAKVWVDPIGIVEFKDYWAESYLNLVNAKAMTQMAFDQKIGRKSTRPEYIRQCPLRLGSPFHPKTGFSLECHVSGKGKIQSWKWANETASPLTKEETLVIIAAYPNLMLEVSPRGTDSLPSLLDWRKQPGNEKKDDLSYERFKQEHLHRALDEVLGVKEEAAAVEGSSPLDTPTEGEEVVVEEGAEESDLDAFAVSTKGGELEGLDDIPSLG
jgi:hypothetical protein